MELKEYIQIIKKNIKLFLAVIVAIIIAVSAYFYSRPVSYAVSMTLNITRSGAQSTDSYKYDDFYRLQADEKFAETIVQWIGSPRAEEDILKDAGINTKNYSLKQLRKSIKAEKLSSQVLSITFSASSEKISQNIAQSISKIISENTQSLNKDQAENAWFEVIFENPVIRINQVDFLMILAVLFGAIFTAFWIVMIKHYLE
jgi:capsular polysaccharide biosynthesis protein